MITQKKILGFGALLAGPGRMSTGAGALRLSANVPSVSEDDFFSVDVGDSDLSAFLAGESGEADLPSPHDDPIGVPLPFLSGAFLGGTDPVAPSEGKNQPRESEPTATDYPYSKLNDRACAQARLQKLWTTELTARLVSAVETHFKPRMLPADFLEKRDDKGLLEISDLKLSPGERRISWPDVQMIFEESLAERHDNVKMTSKQCMARWNDMFRDRRNIRKTWRWEEHEKAAELLERRAAVRNALEWAGKGEPAVEWARASEGNSKAVGNSTKTATPSRKRKARTNENLGSAGCLAAAGSPATAKPRHEVSEQNRVPRRLGGAGGEAGLEGDEKKTAKPRHEVSEQKNATTAGHEERPRGDEHDFDEVARLIAEDEHDFGQRNFDELERTSSDDDLSGAEGGLLSPASDRQHPLSPSLVGVYLPGVDPDVLAMYNAKLAAQAKGDAKFSSMINKADSLYRLGAMLYKNGSCAHVRVDDW